MRFLGFLGTYGYFLCWRHETVRSSAWFLRLLENSKRFDWTGLSGARPMRWYWTSVNANWSYWIFVHVGGIIHDSVAYIYDLGVLMDSKMSLLGILILRLEGLWQCWGLRRGCFVRDPYTLNTFYVSLVRPKLEYASFVWRPFYGAHIDRIESVHRKFVKYTLHGLGWTDMCDLPPFVDRCAKRCANACVMFIFDILSSRVNSSNLLSLFGINAPFGTTYSG
jgi:hypothetical protein